MTVIAWGSRLLWQWILPTLLTLTALIYAVRLRGKPIRGFCGMLRELFSRRDRTQHGIFAAALAATMGTGNLVGTALALMTGGAGAVFWMWLSALLGMVLVYAENMLAARHPHKDCRRFLCCGSIGYILYAMKNNIPARIFAICCIGAALGMGSTVQSSTVARTLHSFGVPLPLTGLVTASLLGIILAGGIKGIRSAAGKLMPLLCGLYFAGCAFMLVRHAHVLPDAFLSILRGAFGIRAAGCGVSISVLLQSLRVGFQRGIFSNEAGLGSSSLLHMHAPEGQQAQQCKWAAAEVFADTILCCTLTALVILTAPCDLAQYTDGTALLLDAFTAGLGTFAAGFLAVCMVLLAFATMIGWYPCGAYAVQYLTGGRGTACYLAAYLLAAFAGALGEPQWLWALCDLMNGCMALPNLCAMLLLAPTVSVTAAAPCRTPE